MPTGLGNGRGKAVSKSPRVSWPPPRGRLTQAWRPGRRNPVATGSD
ncbi:hypothetical protein TVNIR_2916 [Thioalkalivibrio nitratireducens DSM 14787]|uniref:Uncharacterized protein n=1 Tax=Thioalkalivibrio nitratireducens (strain DSM 14787 / UNIQEM 213 / ALEN2) TaxID=1255043 RepID=L0DZS4_THIND|nr:hypothetical protein TVNIR_2916 [Thioalkalivibrio nitratireducens DSM 14787]